MNGGDVPGGHAGRDLFGLAPAEFTAARNALAKQLRSAGDMAEAALVAKLRRPPATAWALNTVARERPDLIDAVVEAGGALRAATEHALAGDASSLRTAQADERRVVDTAASAAAGFLSAAGLGAGDGRRQRMAGTLRAAMVDPAVADALRAGVLDDDRDASGFGLDAFSPSSVGTAPRHRPRSGTMPSPTTAPGAESAEAGAAPAVDEVTARREAKHAADRPEAAAAVEATRQAARAAAAATEAERAAQAARDAAAAARVQAEAAATHARELEATAEAASAEAATAHAAASEAAARATELATAPDPS